MGLYENKDIIIRGHPDPVGCCTTLHQMILDNFFYQFPYSCGGGRYIFDMKDQTFTCDSGILVEYQKEPPSSLLLVEKTLLEILRGHCSNTTNWRKDCVAKHGPT